MNHQDKLTEKNFPNGFATTAELKSAGISGYCINQLCQNGDIVRIKHGLYKIKTLKISDKRNVILTAIPKGVFCMSEALYIFMVSENENRINTKSLFREALSTQTADL